MQKHKQGFALVTALAITVILMGVIAVMVVSTTGDLQQSRSSFQLSQARAAAEAGIAVGHDALQGTAVNSLSATLRAYSTTFVNSGTGNPTTTWVVPQSNWGTVASNLQNTLNTSASSNQILASALNNMGSASIQYQLSNFRGQMLSATQLTNQLFVMDYAITSTGTANNGKRIVVEQGSFSILMGQQSLNRYLFLVNNAGGQGGYFGSSSVFNGPVHANSNWGFRGTPRFTGPVTASDGNIWYHCGGAAVQSPTTSNPPCSVPVYSQGFQFNQPIINLPTSALGQARAALGLDPATDADGNGIPDQPTGLEMCNKLRLSVTCSPVVAPATGVYVPNNGGSVSGGIYVQGNVTGMTLDRPNPTQQRYRIVQGTRTTTILMDFTTNTTTVTTMPAGTTVTYSGVPNAQAPVGTGGANGQIFVNGTISGLTGPARTATVPNNSPQHPVPTGVPAALAKETQLNITATGQVGVSGDLTYECDPTQVSNPTYLAANSNCNTNGQPLRTVLGVMSTTSNIQIQSTAPNDIYLWGSYFTSTPGTGLTVQNLSSRAASGTMHLYSGIIQDMDQVRGMENSSGTLVRGFNESFDYDARFATGAVTPPNFPTTRVFQPTVGAPVPLTFTEK